MIGGILMSAGIVMIIYGIVSILTGFHTDD
jgi:hypothetical protein